MSLKNNNTLRRREERKVESGWFLMSPEGPLAVPAQILQTGQALWEGGAAKTRNCLRRWSFFCDQILTLEPLSNPLYLSVLSCPHSLAPWREKRRSALQPMPMLALWYLALLCCPHLLTLVFVYFYCFFFFFLMKFGLPLPCLPLVSDWRCPVSVRVSELHQVRASSHASTLFMLPSSSLKTPSGTLLNLHGKSFSFFSSVQLFQGLRVSCVKVKTQWPSLQGTENPNRI